MAKVKVDHKVLLNTSNDLEKNTKTVKSKMKTNENKIANMIQSSWSGEDAFLFQNEVKRLLSNDARYKKWIEWNTITSKNLKSAGQSYIQAQVNAINRAWRIRKD